MQCCATFADLAINSEAEVALTYRPEVTSRVWCKLEWTGEERRSERGKTTASSPFTKKEKQSEAGTRRLTHEAA
jgi:hypothetical protein